MISYQISVQASEFRHKEESYSFITFFNILIGTSIEDRFVGSTFLLLSS